MARSAIPKPKTSLPTAPKLSIKSALPSMPKAPQISGGLRAYAAASKLTNQKPPRG